MPATRPEDLFDVFDPWIAPDEGAAPREPSHVPDGGETAAGGPGEPAEGRSATPPAESTPAPSAPGRPPLPAPAPGMTSVARFSSTGALEPGMVVAEAPAEPRRPRWSGRPATPQARSAPPPDPVTEPVDFLRAVVVPGFQGLARRLEASRHYTSVQDLLDLPTPALRVLIWPRPGLLDRQGSRILATFELMLDRSAPGRLTTSYWLGARPEHVIPMAEVPLDRLDLAWVETQILDFVQKVLDRI